MNNALYIAATGMHGQQLGLEAVANNLANLNTPSFKAAHVTFSDLVQKAATAGSRAWEPLVLGSGVEATVALKDLAAGAVKETGAPMDLAIQGRGFLEVRTPDGGRAFTRAGKLTINRDSLLAVSTGAPFRPEIQVPQGTTGLHISPDGHVTADIAGQTSGVEIGRLELVGFMNPAGLIPIGGGLYELTTASGEPQTAATGDDFLGTLAQGALESSNVDLNGEMVALMLAQRSYELSARVFQVADTVMDLTNKLVGR